MIMLHCFGHLLFIVLFIYHFISDFVTNKDLYFPGGAEAAEGADRDRA